MDNYEIGDENEYLDDDCDYEIGLASVNPVGINGSSPASSQEHENAVNNLRNTVDDEKCIVCFVANKDTLVEPCLHLKFCYECIDTINGRAPIRDNVRQTKCPLCRKIIEKYQRVFL